MSSVVEDLKAARDEMARRGRCRIAPVMDDGRVCLIGAIAAAVQPELLGQGELAPYDATNRLDRGEAVARQLKKFIPDQYHGGDTRNAPLFRFNDDPCTTDQDVLNLFDKALADLGGLT